MRERESGDSGRNAAAMALGRYASGRHSHGEEQSCIERAPFDGTRAAMETNDVRRTPDHERNQAGVCA